MKKYITYKNFIDVNLNNVETEVDIRESEQTINEEKITSIYKTSKIEKAQMERVLGDAGKVVILIF